VREELVTRSASAFSDMKFVKLKRFKGWDEAIILHSCDEQLLSKTHEAMWMDFVRFLAGIIKKRDALKFDKAISAVMRWHQEHLQSELNNVLVLSTMPKPEAQPCYYQVLAHLTSVGTQVAAARAATERESSDSATEPDGATVPDATVPTPTEDQQDAAGTTVLPKKLASTRQKLQEAEPVRPRADYLSDDMVHSLDGDIRRGNRQSSRLTTVPADYMADSSLQLRYARLLNHRSC
jgi:hypothetical protein